MTTVTWQHKILTNKYTDPDQAKGRTLEQIQKEPGIK